MSRQQSDKIYAREHKAAQLDKEAREFRDAHEERQPSTAGNPLAPFHTLQEPPLTNQYVIHEATNQPAADPPWRPLEPGEIIHKGDEYRGKNAGWTAIHYSIGEPFNLSDLIDCRTRRPLPSAPPDSGDAAKAKLTGLQRIPSAIGWKCACGEDADPVSVAWRWTGSWWEHHHGGQAGHFRATYTPPLVPPTTCSWRHYDEFEDFDSECGESFAFEDEPDFKRYPFCPACGGRIQLIKQ